MDHETQNSRVLAWNDACTGCDVISLRVPTRFWAASFLAALGIAPTGCGGRAERDDEGEEASSTTAGGTTASQGGSAGQGGTIALVGTSSAGAGTTAGAGGTISGAGAPGNSFPCESPTPVLNEDTGFVRCANGLVTRPFVGECPSSIPRAEARPDYDPEYDTCQYDSDCTDLPYGYCQGGALFPGFPYQTDTLICRYGCVTDSDCAADQICSCSDPIGVCVYSSCTVDADCEGDFHCARIANFNGCPSSTFACQTSADQCATNADCGSMTCDLGDGARVCKLNSCAAGRPFLVHDVARMAGVIGRSDWLDRATRPNRIGLDATLRERLARDWLRAARLEHASIAAFGRFLLELLAFGAPAELVNLTIQAMDDERRHAELCFALASEYAGVPLGPAELDLEGALPAPTLERSLVTAIREGCVGETIAALEAAELAERVSDAVLRAVLTRVAADEKRHAELAFRFVEWALSRLGEHGHALVESEIDGVRSELPSLTDPVDEPATSELARRGILNEGLARAVRAAALQAAVLPALEGQLAHARTRNAA
jgi:hypothetical protein